MRLTKIVLMGVLLLIGLNLLMAMGSIWIFIRMAPAIEVIIERNELSLEACEEMLASIAMVDDDNTQNDIQYAIFKAAYNRALNNITENEEPAALNSIVMYSDKAFQGNISARQKTINAIMNLGEINRQAMIEADAKARKLGYAGAWGIVFMAIIVFFAGNLFYRSLKKNVLHPLEEIHNVISDFNIGNIMRRCTGVGLPADVMSVFNGINELLDKCQFQSSLEPPIGINKET